MIAEMGLGKTIQVIALLAYLELKTVKGPFIICAPLATLPNWMNELKKWLPSTKAALFHGTKEHRNNLWNEQFKKHLKGNSNGDATQVMVTSYEIAILERSKLEKVKWKYMIVDEGQRIKNRDCRLVRELKKLPSENRLLLTGTPIQNTLEELWSLLNFVNPMIFDDLAIFESWFGFRNIGKETQTDDILEDEARDHLVTKLHEILRPFLLRRLKKDVMLDLPPKREVVVYAPMTEFQLGLDDLVRQKKLREALASMGIDAKGASGELLSEKNILMNLRKVSNHPFLIGEPSVGGQYLGEAVPEAIVTSSGKFKLLDRMLTRMKADGHKVLVFSQMTRMLDIMEDLFRLRGYGYCRLDGGTNIDERQRQIDEFNTPGSDLFVFMLSTRAGGLGINLASADTVILFDSDWNPTQDQQAMDRAHRIGQKRPVAVYRLLTANSVEIQMFEKQISKNKLARMTVVGGDFSQAGVRSRGEDSFTVQQLQQLLKDDVNRVQDRRDRSTDVTADMADAEFELIINREKLFDKNAPIPMEGEMYDVVAKPEGGDMLGSMG